LFVQAVALFAFLEEQTGGRERREPPEDGGEVRNKLKTARLGDKPCGRSA
jgi:hypothetical protein